MTDDSQLRDAGWHEITLTTDSYPQWKKKGFPTGTHWDKGKKLFDQIGQTVPPIPPPVPPPTPPSLDTITVAQFNALVGAGNTTIKDKKVLGWVGWTAPNVTLQNVEFDGVDLKPGADGARLHGVKGSRFLIQGVNNWIIDEGSVFDGAGVNTDCIIRGWEGSIGSDWAVRDSFIRNYWVPGMSPSTEHCQGIFLGSSRNGVVEGNHFDSNGNSGHIFISSWGYQASAVPNVKIRGNTFGPVIQAYYSINVHPQEIPQTAAVCVQQGQPTVAPLIRPDFDVFLKAACP